MRAHGALWRGIVWIERFLPVPAAAMLKVERSSTARRHAFLVPLLIGLAVLARMLGRHRDELGQIMLLNLALVEQSILAAALCIAIAAIAVGIKAWRDARGQRW